MEGGSRTARMVAAYRARAGVDRWAAALAGPAGMADAEAYDRAHPHIETYMLARTRFLDDAVLDAIDASIAQVVVLGAGYDTRAARLATEGVRFFEVDHPATQAEKRERLASVEGYPIAAATFVSCDFEEEDFLDRLAAAGFDPDARAVFVWEGVVYYLTEEAVRATLTRLASCHPESRLFFDYVGKRFVAGDVSDAKDLEARERVAEMGEPLRFGINDVVPLLYDTGFRHVRTVSLDEACLTYTGTYERARKLRFQSIAEARVGRFLRREPADP